MPADVEVVLPTLWPAMTKTTDEPLWHPRPVAVALPPGCTASGITCRLFVTGGGRVGGRVVVVVVEVVEDVVVVVPDLSLGGKVVRVVGTVVVAGAVVVVGGTVVVVVVVVVVTTAWKEASTSMLPPLGGEVNVTVQDGLDPFGHPE